MLNPWETVFSGDVRKNLDTVIQEITVEVDHVFERRLRRYELEANKYNDQRVSESPSEDLGVNGLRNEIN